MNKVRKQSLIDLGLNIVAIAAMSYMFEPALLVLNDFIWTVFVKWLGMAGIVFMLYLGFRALVNIADFIKGYE